MQFMRYFVQFCGILLSHCIKFASRNMATITKRGASWFAQIRRKGHKSISKSFPTKGMAQEWTRKIEREIDTLDFQDGRSLSGVALSELIERYSKEMQVAKPFGRNKFDVLTRLKKNIGALTIPEITSEKLMEYIKTRQQVKPEGTKGAGGVTISVELTYLGSVFKAAKQLWKMPIDLDIISETRANLKYMGLRTKSTERDRRPTELEIKQICEWFLAKGSRQKVPMPDLIHFAIATAMRAGEIINLKWDDLNETDRTIIIRDRKHPQEKKGNDQEVPLLADAFTIAMRQPRTSDPRIFPVTDGTISSLFPRACNALKIIDLRFHDLRHEGVSRLFEQGYMRRNALRPINSSF
ncbi:phage integrase family protein [Collimonas pratensis]|uniref:Phage integrase family protein n=2 Tax=Collimonas pratensis TaxID=279113 RepID=A0A127Q923_9BURK|nr:phage integrase family protein [Collimonas pratensis]